MTNHKLPAFLIPEYCGELDAYILRSSDRSRQLVLPASVRLDYLIDGTGLKEWPPQVEEATQC